MLGRVDTDTEGIIDRKNRPAYFRTRRTKPTLKQIQPHANSNLNSLFSTIPGNLTPRIEVGG
jgi:hypothetical protein